MLLSEVDGHPDSVCLLKKREGWNKFSFLWAEKGP